MIRAGDHTPRGDLHCARAYGFGPAAVSVHNDCYVFGIPPG
jgi:hypothetical protein